MTDGPKDDAGGLAGVAGKAIDRLTNEYLIFAVVGLAAGGLALGIGIARNSTVAIVIGALLVLAALVIGAVVYLRGPVGGTGPGDPPPPEFTDALGVATEFADWCDAQVRPYPHVDEKQNHDARWYFGERHADLSRSLGRLSSVADDRVTELGERLLADFERVDPRRDGVTRVEREIALQQVRAGLGAFRRAYQGDLRGRAEGASPPRRDPHA